MSSQNEFRQRGNAARSSPNNSSSSSLPRPGSDRRLSGAAPPRPSPRASPAPNVARRSFSGGSTPSVPFSPQQRSMSYTSQTSVGSNGSRPAYPAAPPYGGGGYAGGSSSNYGGYSASSNGYGNGYNGGSSSRDSDNKYAKKKRKNNVTGPPAGMFIIIGGIIVFVYCIFMTTLYFSTNGSLKSLLKRTNQKDTLSVIKKIEDLERRLSYADTSKRNAEEAARNRVSGQLSRLEREKRLLEEKVEAHEDEKPKVIETLEKSDRREKAFMDQVGWLMDRTRRESKRLVLERFGPGPHKVRITYAVRNKPEDTEKERYSFVIQMAELEQVPHAIHLFLEQVDHGLMEGTHFYLNGPHIVQAGPQPAWGDIDGTDDTFQKSVDHEGKISTAAVDTINKYELKTAEQKVPVYDDDAYESYYSAEEYFEEDKRTRKFQDLGLDQLAFPDYSANFPHQPWTVGYTGRPGGPDWYINKVDNTKGHGPGGQPQHDLNEQGDSCFGIILDEGGGRSMLAAKVYSSDIYGDNSEWHHFISKPIEIVYAEILTKAPILDRHLHLDHLHSQHKVYDYRRKGEGDQKLPDNGEGGNQNGGAKHAGQRPKLSHAAEA